MAGGGSGADRDFPQLSRCTAQTRMPLARPMEKEEMRRGFGLPASAWVAYDPCLAYKNMEGPGPLHVGPGLDGPAP